jgi:hypothetical protein
MWGHVHERGQVWARGGARALGAGLASTAAGNVTLAVERTIRTAARRSLNRIMVDHQERLLPDGSGELLS